jgi:hypothetical protein
MLSGILQSLAYVVVSALLGLVAITDMMDRDAELAASRQFRRVLKAEPDLAAGLAMAAR